MGRLLKRVALDFSWPLNKTWRGFLNPFYVLNTTCEECDGSGYSEDAEYFGKQWYGNAHFDPVIYGANPLKPDNATIRMLAERAVNNNPGYYVSNEDAQSTVAVLISAALGLHKLQPEDKAGKFERAIQREADRLFKHLACAWSHHLVQADVDALVAEGRLRDLTHRPRNAEQEAKLAAQEAAGGSGWWLEEPNGYHPTADEVNEWSLTGMAHDAINRMICIEARCKREGVERTCDECDGKGSRWDSDITYGELLPMILDEFRGNRDLYAKTVAGIALPADMNEVVPAEVAEKLAEDWKWIDPPEGPGYQLWENTSEGSPISPVFNTLDELCEYAAKECSTFGSYTASKEDWKQMLDGGLVHHKSGNAVFM